MTNTLKGCWEKIARAERHMRDLDAVWACWVETSTQTFTSHYRMDETGQFLEVDVIFDGRLPPIALGVILGDLVHDLRSALDHIAWAITSNRDCLSDYQQRRIRFPTTKTPKAFEDEEVVVHAREDSRALLQRCQLYESGNDALGVLQELWTYDKHRTIAVAAMLPDLDTLDRAIRHAIAPLDRRIVLKPGQPMEPQTKVASLVFPASGIDPQVMVQGELALQPAFQDGTRTELEISTPDLIEYVSRVVQSFAPLLRRPVTHESLYI